MVSCSEDQTAVSSNGMSATDHLAILLTRQRVWDESGAQWASLKHPCTSVWSVTSTSDGLVITGGSGGMARIWQEAPPGAEEEVSVFV